MKKFLALILSAVLACGVLVGSGAKAVSASSGDEEPIQLKLGITTQMASPHYRSAELFAEKLEEISGGLMTVQIITDGALGTVAQHFSQLKSGTLDCFVTGTADAEILEGGRSFGVMTTPFVFDSEEHYRKFLDSDIFADLLAEVEGTNGVKYIGETMINLPRCLNTKMPVHSVDDMKGVKIRVSNSPIYLTTWEILGATPVTVDGSPYVALEQGLADAQENDINQSISLGCTDICPYFMYTNYIYQSLGLFMSQATIDKLSEQQIAWINEAIETSEPICTDELKASVDEKVAEAVDNGLTMIENDEMDIASFRDRISENIDKIAEIQGYEPELYEKIRELAD